MEGKNRQTSTSCVNIPLYYCLMPFVFSPFSSSCAFSDPQRVWGVMVVVPRHHCSTFSSYLARALRFRPAEEYKKTNSTSVLPFVIFGASLPPLPRTNVCAKQNVRFSYCFYYHLSLLRNVLIHSSLFSPSLPPVLYYQRMFTLFPSSTIHLFFSSSSSPGSPLPFPLSSFLPWSVHWQQNGSFLLLFSLFPSRV